MTTPSPHTVDPGQYAVDALERASQAIEDGIDVLDRLSDTSDNPERGELWEPWADELELHHTQFLALVAMWLSVAAVHAQLNEQPFTVRPLPGLGDTP